jgi:acyl-CoA thioesterase I
VSQFQALVRELSLRRRSFLGLILAAIITGVVSNPLPAVAETKRVVAFGDSLSAGYNLPEAEGFPKQLEAALKTKGLDVVVENASVSGDTSTGGLERLDWSVADGTQLVILELGGNDALRGIDPALTRSNVDAMLTRLKERNIEVVLAGMLAPPNMGDTYATAFNTIYPDMAAKHQVPLYPFFLDGVITVNELMLEDGIHPNAKGVARIVEGIAPIIAEALAK